LAPTLNCLHQGLLAVCGLKPQSCLGQQGCCAVLVVVRLNFGLDEEIYTGTLNAASKYYVG